MIAGEKGLENEITNVSVLEIPKYEDIWIKGGELVLTTLYAFSDVDSILKLISDFSRLKVTALGIHPGNKSEVFPSDILVKKANELGLPIFLLPKDTPYTTVFSVILGNILNKQAIMLQKSGQINKYLTNILLEGGEENNIATSISDILKKPVAILDELLKPAACAAYDEEGKAIIKFLEDGKLDQVIDTVKFGKANKESDAYNKTINSKVKINDKLYNQIVQEVSINKDNIGYILLWEKERIDEYETNLDLIGLAHASTALALYEMKKKAIIDTERKVKLGFYDDLLNRSFENEEVLIMRAEHLGLAIKGNYKALIVDIDDFEQYYMDNIEKGEEHIQFIKNELYRTVSFAIRELNNEYIVIPKSYSFIILMHINANVNKDTLKQKLDYITGYIHNEVYKRFKKMTVTIGIGNMYVSLLKLADSYEQAKKAIDIGRKVYGANNTFYYSDLGIYNFLSFENISELKKNCEHELQSIKYYQGKDNEKLLDTLEVFLDSNESYLTASKKMNVHVNTIKYRIDRIKVIIGEDIFDNSEAKLKIHLALKWRKIL